MAENTKTSSTVVREAIEKKLKELQQDCCIRKEWMRQTHDDWFWGSSDEGKRKQEEAKIERPKDYEAALKTLSTFVEEHRPLMGDDWPETPGGRKCWAPYLGGMPIDQHYCQMEEGHEGHHCDSRIKWPQGVANDRQMHEWFDAHPEQDTRGGAK